MNIRLNRKVTDTLGAAAILGLAAATYGLGVHPVREHQAQAAVAKSVVAEREAQLASVLEDTAKAREAIKGAEAELKAIFPLHEIARQNERLGELSAAAEIMGLTLDELRPGAVVWDRRFGAVPIRLSGSGGFEPFVAFLRVIASSFPDIRVVSFNLGAQPASPSNVPTFSTELVWFTQPQAPSTIGRAAPGGANATPASPR